MATQIVVIGAGFAGLMAARRLAWRTTGSNITLVNGTEHFIERLRLHQFAANQQIGQRLLSDILRGTGVSFVRGWVTALHPDQRTITVQTDSGNRQIGYDYLVYALGSTIDRDSVPGVREHAYVLTPSGEKSAAALREVLPKLNAIGGSVLIAGGGATGIEAAAEFAESYPNLHVRLVTQGEFGTFINQKVAAYMERTLRRAGIIVQDRTTIAEIRANEALTSTGDIIPFDLCLWTGGFRALTLPQEAGLAVNELGQILTDPFMRSISHPEIYAAGDAAQPVEEPGVPYRMSAFTALVTGRHVAESLSAILRRQQPNPLSFAYYGQAIGLGRHDAIFFTIYPADKARPPYLTGWLGHRLREFFVNFALALPRMERRPGLLYVMGQGRYAATKRRLSRLKQNEQRA